MRTDATSIRNLKFARSLQLFFLLFILIGSILGGASFLYYSYSSKEFVGDLLLRETYGVKLRKDVIEDSLNDVAADLEFLAAVDDLVKYIEIGDTSYLESLARDFLEFVRMKGVYDQLRLFDADGMEIVRINHNSGLPEIVPGQLLQNKGQRYYFKDTMLLERGEVFVSPMDLNIELGKIEIPYKPVIRFGAPLFNDKGQQVGAIIMNFKADRLLGLLRRSGMVTAGQTMLVNSKGYWLLAPNSNDQWGFMFEDKADVNFATRFPDQWRRMQSSESGQLITGGKIFTYETVFPLHKKYSSSSGADTPYGQSDEVFQGDQYFWKLVSYVPNLEQQGYTTSLLIKLFAVGVGLFVVSGGLAWLLAFFLTRKNIYSARKVKVPRRDPLTGLSNRRAFMERLNQMVQHAEKLGSGFSLLAVVVDEFDSIVDTYGEEAGNELLLQIAMRLKGCINLTDTVSRLGEREFVAILARGGDVSAIADVASKVREAMSEPFNLYDGTVNISMLLGMSMYPEDSVSPDALLEKAREV